MLKFKGFGRSRRTDGTPGGLADLDGLLGAEASLRRIRKDSLEVGQMGACDLLCAGEFAQQGVNGGDMQGRNERLQLREQDVDETGNGYFEFCPLLNLVKSVSC